MAPICGIYGRVAAPDKKHPMEISNKNHTTQGGGGGEAEEVNYGSDPSVPSHPYPPTDLPLTSRHFPFTACCVPLCLNGALVRAEVT